TAEGSNLWSPLAVTVIGGLISSTILTLLLLPSAYVAYEDGFAWFKDFIYRKPWIRKKESNSEPTYGA
nr:efflux RND transporter permease subunit [Candidatus Omnitrophota bacterium]